MVRRRAGQYARQQFGCRSWQKDVDVGIQLPLGLRSRFSDWVYSLTFPLLRCPRVSGSIVIAAHKSCGWLLTHYEFICHLSFCFYSCCPAGYIHVPSSPSKPGGSRFSRGQPDHGTGIIGLHDTNTSRWKLTSMARIIH